MQDCVNVYVCEYVWDMWVCYLCVHIRVCCGYDYTCVLWVCFICAYVCMCVVRVWVYLCTWCASAEHAFLISECVWLLCLFELVSSICSSV